MTPWMLRTTACLAGTIALVAMECGLAAAAGSEPPGPSGAVAAPPVDPLETLNEAARTAYRRAKEDALAHTGPVILVEGDNLVLRHGGRRAEVRITPAIYHDLKAVAHVPLALDVMLSPAAGGERLAGDLVTGLRRFRERIVASRPRVAGLELTPAQARRQDWILTASLEHIDAVLRAGVCRVEDRTAFARRLRPVVMANAADAARAEIDALHARVDRWKNQMTAGEWNRLTVIVMGRPLPRKDSLAVQYFARRLGEPGEGDRIVFAESPPDESRALDLLATRLVDTRIGVDFFDDPKRMHRDLLGDAARAHLDRLFGPAAETPAGQGR